MTTVEPRFRHDQPGNLIGHWDGHDVYGVLTGSEPPVVVARYGDGLLDCKMGQSIALGSVSFTASAWGVTIEADGAAPGWAQFKEEIHSHWPDCEQQTNNERERVVVP